MKIFNQQQIREMDAATIAAQNLAPGELMNRAVKSLADVIKKKIAYSDQTIHVFAGSGNNGGDGIGIARELAEEGRTVHLYFCDYGPISADNQIMRDSLPQYKYLQIFNIVEDSSFPIINPNEYVIDALFGNGLGRPVEGLWASLIQWINASQAYVFSIDLPSGMHPDIYMDGSVIQADQTLVIGSPRRSLFYLENQSYVGDWQIIDIQWATTTLSSMPCNTYYVDKEVIKGISLQPRKKFAHKGNFGHALLVNGSYGKMGAAILAARSCLRSGVGLLTCHVPRIGYPIMQTSIPEAMISVDQHDFFLHSLIDSEPYTAVGIGSGIDHRSGVKEALSYLLQMCSKPMVLDADALNIIAAGNNWLQRIPDNSVITPHPGEFRRLFGDWENDADKLAKQRSLSLQHKIYIILKGAHTSISSPNGRLYFNSTGNPGMATAGSGDTLTGILTALLARGIPPLQACILGVYIHGLAGDLAAQSIGQTSLISSDIIEYLGKAFIEVDSYK